MVCKFCGKEIEDGSKFCPDCGKSLIEEEITPPEPATDSKQSDAPAEKKKEGEWNVLSIVAFCITMGAVLQILSFGGLTYIATLVLGIIALNQIKKDPSQQGKGFAVATVIISAVSLGIALIGGIVVAILSILGMAIPAFFELLFGGLFNAFFDELLGEIMMFII